MSFAKPVFVLGIIVLLGFQAFSTGKDSFERIVKIELDECFQCDERLVYVPTFETVEVLSEDEAFVGIIAIEVYINNSGKVVSARPNKRGSHLGKLIAEKMLEARFVPKAENGLWVKASEVLYFRILPVVDGVAVPIADELAEFLPIPEIPENERERCSIRVARVLIEFDQTNGSVAEARMISGDESLAKYLESAASKAEFQIPPDWNREGPLDFGILRYRIPRSRSCSPRITTCIITSKPINLAKPLYPVAARFANIKGTVSVSIVIDEDGWVVEASAESGHPLLRRASVVAAQRSRFLPTSVGGHPVTVRGVIVYYFKD